MPRYYMLLEERPKLQQRLLKFIERHNLSKTGLYQHLNLGRFVVEQLLKYGIATERTACQVEQRLRYWPHPSCKHKDPSKLGRLGGLTTKAMVESGELPKNYYSEIGYKGGRKGKPRSRAY